MDLANAHPLARPVSTRAHRFLRAAVFLVPLCAGSQGFVISTVAGNGAQGYFGDAGPAPKAEIWALSGLAVDAAGNIFIADTGNSRIRKVTPDGTITTICGNGIPDFSGDGGLAINAEINFPRSVAVDPTGIIYIADTGNARIRKIGLDGKISTIAGDGNQNFLGDGTPAISAEFYDPWSLALDSAGALYIVDRSNQRVRKIANGMITTVVGSGQYGYAGDGGKATDAEMYAPDGVALDAAGNIYVSESVNATVRKVTTDGKISTLVGIGGTFGFSGDGGPAAKAVLNDPQGVAVDFAGNVFVADEDNQRIRAITTDGIINTIAGNGTKSYSGDGGPSLNSGMNLPQGLAAGPNGIYMVDSGNHRVRVLTATPSIKTGGIVSDSDFGQFPTIAPGTWIEIYGFNLATGARSWAGPDFNGPLAPSTLGGTTVTVGGKSAFIAYESGGQIDAQVPSDAPLGLQPVVVTTAGGASTAFTVTVNATQPGLLAPAALKIGGKQYAAAFFSDGTTFALPPGAIAGVNSKRAKAGDTLTLYGVGFGPVTPNSPAGQIVAQANMLSSNLTVLFGTASATLAYQGLTPGLVGLYQFNVVVPSVPASDLVPLTFTLGGVPGTQTLYLPVQ